LIALIINAHPKIDERDVELFSQNQCLSLGLRPAIQPLEQALK